MSTEKFMFWRNELSGFIDPPWFHQCARGGYTRGRQPLLWGEPAAAMRASAFCWRVACFRRGGNPPAPACPRRGKRERGRSKSSTLPQAAGLLFTLIRLPWSGSNRRRFASFRISHRRFALLPFALFSGALAPVPVGVLDLWNGCCHLSTELNRLRFRKRLVPPRPRSHPNSAIWLPTTF